MKLTRLNCFFVAVWLWLKSRGRFVIGTRRSESFKGLIPHFIVVREGEQGCSLIDYVPVRRKEDILDLEEGSALLFKGQYRIRKYVLIEETCTTSLEDFRKEMGELK